MLPRIAAILGWLRRLATSRSELLVENLARRQQLAILTAKRPRPRMRAADRLFWVALRRLWPRRKEALVIIRPDTGVRWHREGFRKHWTWKSRRRRVGRPSTTAEIRALVQRMAAETRPGARRDLLDHVIVINARHRQRLLSELVAYDHDDRTHLGLGKGTPSMRRTGAKAHGNAEIIGHPRLGGLHHRYEWRQAA